MVDQDHVDAALRKLGTKNEASGNLEMVRENPFDPKHQLMFEQESWDKVLRKMGGGAI
jgi:AP-1-like transcription factor